jgi:hypothetical protein
MRADLGEQGFAAPGLLEGERLSWANEGVAVWGGFSKSCLCSLEHPCSA